MGVLVTLFFLYWVYYFVSQFRRRGEFTSNSYRDGTVDYCIKCGDFHPLHKRCNPISKFINKKEMNIKETLKGGASKITTFQKGVLAVAVLLLLIHFGKKVYNTLPEGYETTTIVDSTAVKSTVTYRLVNPMDYPYGETVRDILDLEEIPYYEPVVQALSRAYSSYILRHMASTYKINKKYLDIDKQEYDLYYSVSDSGQVYRDSVINNLIKYVGE